MTARQQWFVVLGIVAVLGVALFAATRLLGDELFPVAVGMQAPPAGVIVMRPRSGGVRSPLGSLKRSTSPVVGMSPVLPTLGRTAPPEYVSTGARRNPDS